eukprot:752276-Hanusia_phi.AAC.8
MARGGSVLMSPRKTRGKSPVPRKRTPRSSPSPRALSPPASRTRSRIQIEEDQQYHPDTLREKLEYERATNQSLKHKNRHLRQARSMYVFEFAYLWTAALEGNALHSRHGTPGSSNKTSCFSWSQGQCICSNGRIAIDVDADASDGHHLLLGHSSQVEGSMDGVRGCLVGYHS